MRSVIFAAGLVLAATSVFAEQKDSIVPNPSNYLTLANGCVYGPNFYGAPNEWSLVYKTSGTTATCASSIFGISQKVARTPMVAPDTVENAAPQTVTQAISAPLVPAARPRINPKRGFLVGVFR